MVALLFACSDKRTDPVFLAYNGVFLAFYTVMFLLLLKKETPPTEADPEVRKKYLLREIGNRRTASGVFLGMMLLEVAVNVVNFGVRFPATYVANYPSGTTYAASMIRYMNERESNTPFYRAEVTHSQTLNDGALNGYNGISTFTSSANVHVTEFMQRLGYGAKNTYNRYCFEESSPINNLFLGLKYMLERGGASAMKENNYFTEIHHYGDVYLLENNTYLPLGFLANSELSDLDWNSNVDNFTFQNRLLTAASGVGNAWNVLGSETLNVSAEGGAVISSQSSLGSSSYTCSGSDGTVVYTYTPDRDGLLCIDLNLSARNSYRVSVNGTEIYSKSYSLPLMLSVCQVQKGDNVEIRLDCTAGKNGSITVLAAVLDEAMLRQAYDVLSASTYDPSTFSATKLSGSITCNRDGLLYTSVPQNGNWKISVDGSPAAVTLVGGAMIAIPLSAGEHTVTFTYYNTAFTLGWKISLVCFVMFGVMLYLCRKPQKATGRYEARRK